jgi:hypothetical protein
MDDDGQLYFDDFTLGTRCRGIGGINALRRRAFHSWPRPVT